MPSPVHAYLERIHYTGPLAPTLETLRALHRAHLHAIPYENLDIHFGRPLSLNFATVFGKLVTDRRGGWCYEMNNLFAGVLRELGFAVHLLGGAVNRVEQGDTAALTHLVLLVSLDQPYLTDVGFGNGLLEPLPLRAGTHRQDFLQYRLERVGEWWRFHNDTAGGPSFDFTLRHYALTDFTAQCQRQQTAPDSGFVRLPVCHRFRSAGIASLRGAVLTTLTSDGRRAEVLESAAAYGAVVEDVFGLLVDSARLWHSVWPRHLEWIAQQAGEPQQ